MILFGANTDTELLALRSVIDDLPHDLGPVGWFHPDRTDDVPDVTDARIVVVRLLGGIELWETGFGRLRRQCVAADVPLVAVGGEFETDPELLARSTVPAGVVAEAHRYLYAGGPRNIANLLRFLSDTVTMTGFGFEPPAVLDQVGVWDGAGLGPSPGARDDARPLIGVVFYRAHLVAGNTSYVRDLCDAIHEAGGDAIAIWTYSLRPDDTGAVPALDHCRNLGVDVIITSTLAAGSTQDGGDGWSVPGLEDLGIPVIQSPASSRPRAEWAHDDAGLSPLDCASGVAIPEFDGRIIGPTYAFKEVVDDDADGEILATRAHPERAARLASLAVRTARLRCTPAHERRVAVVLSAYPTKRARLGNAVGLDTPASAIELLDALRDDGVMVDRIPADGDSMMAELADTFTYDHAALTDAQVALTVGALDADSYGRWFADLPDVARDDVERLWGPAPGDVYVRDEALHFPGLDLGNVLVTIQPPRGFGADPIATYHAPDLPPPHHYLAFYRWLASSRESGGWGADAIVHLGKHGTVEWLPGKALALSAGCHPDAAVADVPFFYPFVVNDPGEGSQAKRRIHAVVIDHLPPPLTRADTYDDLARLEQLLDALANAEAMDPPKVPALRSQVWEVIVSAEIHRDLDLGDEAPEDEDAFGELVLHVDGYLCALKDAQIRGGLHVLGRVPADDTLIDLVLAVTRLPQGSVPSLRATVAGDLGIDLADAGRVETDRIEDECRRQVEALAADGWDAKSTEDPTLRWIADRLVPDLRETPDEIANLLGGLRGERVPAGPSGAPSRGAANVLPTGRNFYSVDPKGIPSPLAWEVGSALADRVVGRHRSETGQYPKTVGIVLWGTAAMRTSGDDAAEALALLGVKPTWDEQSRRITGLEVIPLDELGRPRVDVTLRISGFFRDAFPHVIELLDDAVALVAALDEPTEQNPVAATGADDARLWGPPPGGYGSGILPVLEQGSWRTQADLAEVYLAWSGFAYGRDRHGEADPDGMRRRFSVIEVAVKNQDNREHDIFDSDDYLQDHGGMVAAVRALTGSAPKAWIGDSADPAHPKVRSLKEEAARVVRSRVLNPKWIIAMQEHGYKGAFELAATVDYLFGYDAVASNDDDVIVEDWMYDKVTDAYVADPNMREFFERSNPWALRSIAERLLEAADREMWDASDVSRKTLTAAVLEAEGWEEAR
ncbi:MAG: cobaltochelatase subunit CobN [Acidimicrobiales bacterium]|nr:cobaltochelatase subunit CobN [Acidimicrobiales bacterium]